MKAYYLGDRPVEGRLLRADDLVLLENGVICQLKFVGRLNEPLPEVDA